MNKNYQLTSLLDLYKKGTLTQDQLSELSVILIENNHQVMNELIDEEWQRTSAYSTDINSSAIFRSIRNRLGMKGDRKPDQKTGKLEFKLVFLQISRYAAVFILAFSLAWLLLGKAARQTVVSDQTKYFKIKVAYGSKSTIELPDSSLVILNSGSALSYPAQFEENNRTVLLSGEGYFEVKKNKNRPFYVKTNDVTVKVLGTKFNVKAYPDENITETTLVTGSVEITENKVQGANKSPILLLEPNQKATLKKETKKAILADQSKSINNAAASPKPIETALTVQKEIKTELYTAWKSNVLILNNERFINIVKRFERWYNVEIKLESDQLSNIRFSAKFDRESIRDALDALKLVQPFKYTMNKNKISIYK